mmetsp:Transcript_13473/g.43062  ORF Transcript_13473/g.43062 Transcript_13473/m.43062 type:complete len:210 (-) Transcript_13473:188-817(-)
MPFSPVGGFSPDGASERDVGGRAWAPLVQSEDGETVVVSVTDIYLAAARVGRDAVGLREAAELEEGAQLEVKDAHAVAARVRDEDHGPLHDRTAVRVPKGLATAAEGRGQQSAVRAPQPVHARPTKSAEIRGANLGRPSHHVQAVGRHADAARPPPRGLAQSLSHGACLGAHVLDGMVARVADVLAVGEHRRMQLRGQRAYKLERPQPA